MHLYRETLHMQQGRDNVTYRGETRVMLGEETLFIHNYATARRHLLCRREETIAIRKRKKLVMQQGRDTCYAAENRPNCYVEMKDLLCSREEALFCGKERHLLSSREETLVMQQGRDACYAAGKRHLICSRVETLVIREDKDNWHTEERGTYYRAGESHLLCRKRKGRDTCYGAGTRNLLCSRDEELVMQQ